MVLGSCNVILFCCFSSTCVPGPGVQQPKPQRAGPLVPRYLRLVLDIWTLKIEESIFGKIEIYSAVLQHSALKQWNVHLFKYYHRAYKIFLKITKLAMSFLVQKPCSISFSELSRSGKFIFYMKWCMDCIHFSSIVQTSTTHWMKKGGMGISYCQSIHFKSEKFAN